jgi:hypothetical protein
VPPIADETIEAMIKKMTADVDYAAIEIEGERRMCKQLKKIEAEADNAKNHFTKKFK